MTCLAARVDGRVERDDGRLDARRLHLLDDTYGVGPLATLLVPQDECIVPAHVGRHAGLPHEGKHLVRLPPALLGLEPLDLVAACDAVGLAEASEHPCELSRRLALRLLGVANADTPTGGGASVTEEAVTVSAPLGALADETTSSTLAHAAHISSPAPEAAAAPALGVKAPLMGRLTKLGLARLTKGPSMRGDARSVGRRPDG